jgi:hypothetical protein
VTSLVYVYAVLPRPIASDIAGINAQPVRWVVDDGLAAAVSDVPAEDFDEAPLNDHIRDLAWLGPRAVAHQDVNARLHEQAEAIVPLAFGTVFRDDDRVRHLLHEQRPTLVERLQIATSTPGRAHLLQRRLAELERDERRRLEAESRERLVASLREIAADVYLEPLPSDAVERPLVRASLLVPRTDASRFLEQVERLRVQWPEPVYRLLMSGPWPPYRFGGLQPAHA